MKPASRSSNISGFFIFITLLFVGVAFFDKCQGANIVELLQAEQYTVMYDFVNRFPDLVALLSNTSINTTVFAPSNAAFNSIVTNDGLHEILRYHLLPGETVESEFIDNELVSTLLVLPGLNNQPQKIKVVNNSTGVFVNGARIVRPDLFASNGVVHGLEAVLIPPGTITFLAANTPDLSSLSSAITLAGLSNALEGPALTAFAPTNEAFVNFAQKDPILVGYLSANDSQAHQDLQSVLNYHVTGSVLYSTDIPSGTTLVPSLDNGVNLTVTNSNGVITVNGAEVLQSNVLAANGVVHVIDEVLLPHQFDLNLRQTLLGLNLTTLVDLFEEANLTSLLTGPVNYTIFAPTNAAFHALSNLPSGQALVDVLSYHLTPGQILTTLLSDGTLLPSLLSLPTLPQNQKLKIFRMEDNIQVNGVNITNANTPASNGMVQVINQVLIPPGNLVTVANTTTGLSTLVTAVQAANLANTLSTTGNLTLFAPINSAFNALPPVVLSYLLAPQGLPDLQSVLTYHVVPNAVIYSADVTSTPQVFTTLNGENVTIVKNDSVVAVNQDYVNIVDLLASNGVAYALDGVLIPNSFVFTLAKVLVGVGATDLLAAIETAGLSDLLNGTTKYTIFAPTNAAFARHPPPSGEALVNLLKYHVVAGTVLTSGLSDGQLLPTLLTLPSLAGNAQQVKVSIIGTSVFINGVNVTQADLMAANGVVHVIDDVLSEPVSIDGVVNSTFATLQLVANHVDFATVLSETANITLFAPTDAAFSKLSSALLNYLMLPQAKEDLISVLSYHVLTNNTLYSAEIPTGASSYPTLNGADLSLNNNAGTVTVNNVASVVEPDLLASNGVVHGIDSVLLPPGFAFDLHRALIGLNATLLLDALNETGLETLLNGTSNYTLFAPTNSAMAALGNVSLPELVEILSYHVVPGYIATTELVDGELLSSLLIEQTLQDRPQRLKISIMQGRGSQVFVNNINVTIPNNFASNGVVHVIDAVLMPPQNIPTIASETPSLSTLTALVTDAGLLTALESGNLTLFAPTNAAFTALGAALLNYLQLPASKADLTSILAYHVLPNTVLYTPDIPTTPTPLPTLNGADVTVDRQQGTNVVTVNSATVQTPNVLASNGVVHVLDGVLLPPGFSFDLRRALIALNATVLVSLMDNLGLSSLLNGTANYTIFAPTNEAFNSLPNNMTHSQLVELLSYHVVSGIHRRASLSDGELLPSLATLTSLGDRAQLLKISLNGSSFSVNNVNVTSADSLASNGVVHVISKVLLLPPVLPDVVMTTPELSKLSTLVTAAGIEQDLGVQNLTLFAPTDEGFDAVGPAIYNFLLLPAAKSDLVAVLKYHAHQAAEILYSPSIPEGQTVLTTLNGAEITVDKTAQGAISVNNVSVVTPDVLAANGVAHTIRGVLLPPDFVFNLRRALIGINATVLLDAMDRVGLDNILNSTSPYTIFAPTNEALASLPSNTSTTELTDILRYHIVPGAMPSSSLSNGQLLSSLLTLQTLMDKPQRLKISITNNQLFVDDALVTIPNNMATNGVVHVINKVIIPPPDIGAVARSTDILHTLVRVIQIVEQEARFTVPNMTALAPSNEAFNNLGAATLGYLLSPQAEDALENILLYHVLPETVLYTPDLPAGTTTVRSANGLDVSFVKTGNKVTVNGAEFTVPNVLASNGVLHILGSVLLPSNFRFTLLNALEGLGETEMLEAFEVAGLSPLLNGTQNYTIFAPTKEAFEHYLPKGVSSISVSALTDLLKTHIVEGRFPLEAGMELPTLNNKTLTVGPNATTIALKGTKVVADILGHGNVANNGVLYQIDEVLVAPSKKDDDDDGLSTTWIIVIAVVCSVAAVAVLAVGGYFGYTYWLKRQNSYVAIGGDYEDS